MGRGSRHTRNKTKGLTNKKPVCSCLRRVLLLVRLHCRKQIKPLFASSLR